MEETFYFFSWQDINLLKSELLLVIVWLITFCGLLLPKKMSFVFVPFVSSSVLLINILLLSFSLINIETETTTFFWNDLFYQNKLTYYLKLLTSVSALFAIWIQNTSYTSNLNNKTTPSEWFVILLGGVLSAQFLLSSASIFGIYISLEMLSICGYLLVTFYDTSLKKLKTKSELIASSFNYLVFGAVSTACLLYGFSWWYGLSGSLSIPQIFDTVAYDKLFSSNIGTKKTTFLVGFLLIGIGFLFKLAAVPLHFWISNVYKTTSTGTIFFLATVSKIATTGVLLFIFKQTNILDYPVREIIFSVLSVLGVISAIFGGFLAIQQRSFRQFFAYSGVSQIGFLLLILVYNFKYSVVSEAGILIFWVFYILSNAIIWKFCSEIEKTHKKSELFIQDLSYLPFLEKIILSLASLSLAGLPPLGGFLVKIVVIFITFQNYQHFSTNPVFLFSLFGIGIATLVGFFYYLKIPYLLFLKNVEIAQKYKISTATLCVTGLLIVINFALAIFALRFF